MPRRDETAEEGEPLVLSTTPEQRAEQLTAQIEQLRKNLFPPKGAIKKLEEELALVLNQIEGGE